MTKDPNRNLAHNISQEHLDEIQRAVDGGLPELNLRQLLGVTLSLLAEAERKNYLKVTPNDKGNGYYGRSLALGSIPVEVHVPRTRKGTFRPSLLPERYERSYSDEMQPLIMGLLSSSRSVNAAKSALSKMGLPASGDDLDTVAREFIEVFELHNSRPVDTDLLALFVDGKYVEIKEGDRLRPACIYVAVGLGRDGKKRVLACVIRLGKENLEDWKKIFRSLIERGLRRVMVVVQDDFSGLLPITKSLFPRSDIQLCIVHMQRNAKSHLSKNDAAEFQQRIRAIKVSWDPEQAAQQFEELCEHFASTYPSFIAEVRKKKDHYLSFLKYPESIRRTFSTTNLVEAVNKQLEQMRLNSGGYFHSEDTLKLKLGITISCLEDGIWRSVATNIQTTLVQLNVMFDSHFESEE